MESLARCGMEMREMQERPGASATTSVAVDEPIPQAGAAVAPVDVPATEGVGHRLLTSLRRVLAGPTNAAHRRPYSPPYYLERARLSREIERL
jgi:hypothetical protein